jgi:ubiquinone/menaquinone biosynthesis C-methylase UbiE/uncharacterized protein YbaR (Trm112 family)
MKYRLLDLLQAVEDGSQLRVAALREVKTVSFKETLHKVACSRFCAYRNAPVDKVNLTPRDCQRCYAREIIDGDLVSGSGVHYRVKDGIPRLLSASSAEFLQKNKKSFSLEWKYFRFGERNWGMDIESRKKLFLEAMGKPAAELRGKLMLDAGCGSGLLSMEIANSFGMEVVAMDLSTGIERAYRTNTNPFVHYVQASVLEPPVAPRAVDFIYCAGVLLTLPYTRRAFGCLPRCLKIGGRYFVWLYHPLERHRATGDYGNEVVYEWLRSRITSRLPIRLQEAFYLCLLVPYFLKRALLNPFRTRKEDRTWREKMQNFVDTMSPIHANRFTEDQVLRWYRESDFPDAVVAYIDRYGIGYRGDLAAAPAA